jgi:hypothetical protein
MHRRHSFLPGSLKRFIQKYDLSFAYLQVPPEMSCRKQERPGEKFFILTLRRPGLILKMPYSQGSGVRSWPDIERTLETLASDILLYLNHNSAGDLAESFGEEPGELDQMWEIVKSLTERTKQFLGPEGFDELIAMGESNFEMGGDRGWLRYLRTCG